MKRNNKISLSELAELVKKAMNEEFDGGVNYDADVAVELKSVVGHLSTVHYPLLQLSKIFYSLLLMYLRV